MFKFSLLFAVFFALISIADEKARSMEDMHGGCSNYKMKLDKELELWKSKPVAFQGSIQLGSLHSLELKPQNQIKFTVEPEKFFSKDESRNAGIFPFSVPSDGIYKISSGSKVWFDVADSEAKKLVPSKEFEMQTQCSAIFKVVTFSLKANVHYLLQINSSLKPSSLFLITKD